MRLSGMNRVRKTKYKARDLCEKISIYDQDMIDEILEEIKQDANRDNDKKLRSP